MTDRDFLQISIKEPLAELIACIDDKTAQRQYNQLIDKIMAWHERGGGQIAMPHKGE